MVFSPCPSAHFRLRNTPRVYVYRPSHGVAFLRPVSGALYRTYIDRRANVPYYLCRVSGVDLVRNWRKTVRAMCASSSNYQGMLQGFFAGEGNIKETKSHGSRVLRISQGKRFGLLERILQHFGVEFRYETLGRNYVISGRDGLEKLWVLGISELHSGKHVKFEAMLSSYRQHHYKRLSLGPRILENLSSPLTAREVASLVNRGESRVTQVLTRLLRDNEVEKFKVRSTYFWTKNVQQEIVISDEKSKILGALTRPRRRLEIARIANKSERSVTKRLAELAWLGLVEKVNSNWRRKEVAKRVIVK